MEFTIERGKLYMLQTRNGKTIRQLAALQNCRGSRWRKALCTEEEAILKVEPKAARLAPASACSMQEALKAAEPVANGLPASPGAACGAVYFTAEDRDRKHCEGKKYGSSARAGNVSGGHRGYGVLQKVSSPCRGGMTSHAAVVARGMGTCCVSGCGDTRSLTRRLKHTYGRRYTSIKKESACPSTVRREMFIWKAIPDANRQRSQETLRHVMGWADDVQQAQGPHRMPIQPTRMRLRR